MRHAVSDTSPACQVEEIALYNTTFRKLDGGIVLFSNALIASTGFSNLSRSGLHNESFKVRCQVLAGYEPRSTEGLMIAA